jgi:lysozyme
MLIADLERDEGNKSLLYDDFNGAPLGKGSVIRGNPTIAIGWAVSLTPINDARARIICGWQADDKAHELFQALPWVQTLSEGRQRALLNMAFNIGVHGEEQFITFLSLMKSGDYAAAADDLAQTLWAKQVGVRAARITALIRSG